MDWTCQPYRLEELLQVESRSIQSCFIGSALSTVQ